MTVEQRMEIGTSTAITSVRLIIAAVITLELVVFAKLLMLL